MYISQRPDSAYFVVADNSLDNLWATPTDCLLAFEPLFFKADENVPRIMGWGREAISVRHVPCTWRLISIMARMLPLAKH